jgi:hypothetical protein
MKKPDPSSQALGLPSNELQPVGPATPKRLDLPSRAFIHPVDYPSNLARRDQVRRGNEVHDDGTLNRDLLLHNQGHSICSPLGDYAANWLDRVDTKMLILVEDFVQLIEQCDLEVWRIAEDANRNKIVVLTILGNACSHFLPLLADLRFADFLNKGVLYSNRFYALLQACEQIQFEELNFHSGRYENPLSPWSQWHVHNALIRYTRFHARRQCSCYTLR